jgi:hypothetical protein
MIQGTNIFRRSVTTTVGTLVATLLLASAAVAQESAGRRALPPPAVLPPALQDEAADLPSGWVEQLQEMRPAEQERFLRNSLRFRSLPAEEQALIRRRLRIWNGLSLNQRQALLDRQQIWEQLPQQQRRQVRESLLPRWQSLPAPSRRVILGKLRELRGLNGAQRDARLSDESFLSSMNAEEREMLRDLSSLGAGQTAN